MRHIHTCIVSMHLATRGNYKILCTPPPHIISSKDIYFPATLVAPLPNSPFLKSNLYKVDAKSICPSVTLTRTTHIISSTALIHCNVLHLNAPHFHPRICGQILPKRLPCWPNGRRSWLVDHKQQGRTPPTRKGHMSG